MKILLYQGRTFDLSNPFPLAEELKKYGFEVEVFDWQNYINFDPNISAFRRIRRKLFANLNKVRLNLEFKKCVFQGQYDIVLIVMGRHLHSSVIRTVAQNSVSRLCYWSTDDPLNSVVSDLEVQKALKFYSLVFTPRPQRIECYRKLSSAKFISVEWYAHPVIHAIGEQSVFKPRQFDHRVSFVGSYSSERYSILKSLDVNNISVFGWGWNRVRTQLKQDQSSRVLSLDDMCGVFLSSQINLNFFTKQNFDVTNMRLYEIAAVGGFQIVEDSEAVRRIFEDGVEVVTFKNIEDLNRKIKFYLARPELCRQIGLAGYKKYREMDYSYKNRVAAMARELNEQVG